MLQILTHDILPVFFLLALGFAMGRFGKASEAEARALNRIAFIVLQPGLIFGLVSQVDFPTFDFGALGLYILCEAITFAVTYLVARRVFGREHLESWLLAMATIFVNSLLYIWPISTLIYGPAGALPVTAIVAWDSTGSFAFFIVTMELMAGRDGIGMAARRVVTNPVLVTIVIGILVNTLAIPVPEPVHTAAHFAGAAAAPLVLFALGVMLSGQALTPSPVVGAVSAIKLFFFPALVWGALALASPGNPWSPQFLLTAAGPSGAMAFSLALLYGVRTDAIAPVIIWTSALTLISLAALA